MHVRLDLLRKIHQYIKDRSLHLKYASAYALGAVDKVDEIALEVNSLHFFNVVNLYVVVSSLSLWFSF